MPTLIILAGGRSTRFGRSKQLEPVGPEGEALLDYTLQDAFEAGCKKAVIVIRPEDHDAFNARFGDDDRVRLVEQRVAFGTGHAVLLALEGIRDTVVVANGDNLYGQESLELAVRHALQGDEEHHALVAFRLGKTLSRNGAVNRAICTTDVRNMLRSTEEVVGLKAQPDGRITSEDGRPWAAEALVSMDLWVLRPRIFVLFRAGFSSVMPRGAEYGISGVVASAIAQEHRFAVLTTNDPWYGLTNPGDADLVRRKLAERA